MLGHLKPSLCSLGAANKVAYRTLYCSICASLRQQYSLPYSLFINNEMTLVLLALQPYYQADTIETACPAAALTQKNPAATHPAIDTAAKLSVLLGWVKVVDWETDQPRFYKKYLRRVLQSKVDATLLQISSNFRSVIEDYLILTKANSSDETKVRHYSGLLSRQVVLEVGKRTNIGGNQLEELANLFELSGELIAIADHLIDLEEDMMQQQFNPIVFYSEEKQVTLSVAYYYFLRLCNHLKIYCLEEIERLYQWGIIETPFRVAMQQSLQSISREIHQKRPVFLADESEIIGGLQVAQQDCGGLGVEACNCAVQQGEIVGAYTAQCPCGQCCDAGGGCCKGCGDCCGGCGKGCNQCSGNCNNCCGGCNNACSGCSKNCDSGCGACDNCNCSKCFRCCDDCAGYCNDGGSGNYEPPVNSPELPTEVRTDSMVVGYKEYYDILGKIEGKTIEDRRTWKAIFDSLQVHDPNLLRLVFDGLNGKTDITLEEMRLLMDSLKGG